MYLTQATSCCPRCERKFHQIDSTEERACAVVQDALARHMESDHEDEVA